MLVALFASLLMAQAPDAPALFEGPPELSQRTFEMLGATVDLPTQWTVISEELESTSLRIDAIGGLVQITRGGGDSSLRKIRRGVLRAARKAGWKTVERRWTRLSGKKALALMFDVGSDAAGTEPRHVVRQLFYFAELGGELWVVHFGTRKDRFDYDAYRVVASSLQPR
ncbi:MAG: hypothetical protein ACI9WU_002357 [Myxococcota bacterium]|jgi:hypothetical protein